MARLEPKPIVLSNINGGDEYIDGNGVAAQTINDCVEGVAYACEIVEDTPVDQVSEHDVAELVAASIEVGTVTKAQEPNVTVEVFNGKALMNFVIPTSGTKGDDGQDGTDGVDGTTFTPSVSSAGVLSWTNDGGKQNPPSVDIVAAVIAQLPVYDGTGD